MKENKSAKQYTALPDAAKMLGISYYSMRAGVLSGRFPFVRFGRSRFVDVEQVRAILEREAEENQRQAKEANEGAGGVNRAQWAI